MVSRREYCPIACAVDVLGDRWTPLIIRELMVGAHGFNEIHVGYPGRAGPCSPGGCASSSGAGS
jgi:DNA-binding HxlR family transcriptional regulator